MSAPIQGLRVEARELEVRAARGRLLLDRLSFAIEPGQFVAVLGSSGAGKSTLLRALNGSQALSWGELRFDGLGPGCLPAPGAIGYVPQDDIIHPELTVWRALLHAAALRLPAGTPARERRARVRATLADVGLEEQAGSLIGRLSVGQRKRVCIAVEVLTRPELLLLDEPTSSLDPPLDRQVVSLLRRFADEGQTVVLVTHKLSQIDLCDRVLILGSGGRLAFFGSPDEARAHFETRDLDTVYDLLDGEEPSRRAQARFRRAARPAELASTQPIPAAPGMPVLRQVGSPLGSSLRQFAVLAQRYLEILTHDGRNLSYLVLQPLAVALMLRLVADPRVLVDPAQPLDSNKIGFLMVAVAAWLGIVNSVREIVKERAIQLRERQVGVGDGPYLASKLSVLGLIAAFQIGALLAILALLGVQLPTSGVLLSGPVELYVSLLGTALAGLVFGLALSALAASRDRAITLVPLLLIPQFVFANMIFRLDGPVDSLSWLIATRAGFQAVVATVRPALDAHGQALDATVTSVGYLLACWQVLAALVGCGLALTFVGLRLRAADRSRPGYAAATAALLAGLAVVWGAPLAVPHGEPVLTLAAAIDNTTDGGGQPFAEDADQAAADPEATPLDQGLLTEAVASAPPNASPATVAEGGPSYNLAAVATPTEVEPEEVAAVISETTPSLPPTPEPTAVPVRQATSAPPTPRPLIVAAVQPAPAPTAVPTKASKSKDKDEPETASDRPHHPSFTFNCQAAGVPFCPP